MTKAPSNLPVECLYQGRRDFTVIGLTGIAGSGCSTLASYMSGRDYLNYVRAELKFSCDWKRKLFATNFTVVSELVMTDREDAPPHGNIPYRESFTKNQVLSDKVQDFYDEKFWEDYNIIEPTESLEYAVQRLKKANDKSE